MRGRQEIDYFWNGVGVRPGGAIVTRNDRFRRHLQGKTQNRNVNRNAPKPRFEYAPEKMPDFAIIQAWNCGKSSISAQDAAGARLDL